MKKVIALTLVMAATTFAANLDVAIQGPAVMAPGESGTIDIVLVGDAAATATVDTANMLVETISNGADLQVTGVTMNAMLFDVGADPMPATMAAADGYIISYFGPYMAITTDFVAFSFDVVALEGVGTIEIGLYDHNVAQTQHNNRETNFNNAMTGETFTGSTTPLVVEVIPEPASLALLAIGGLAVIRRR